MNDGYNASRYPPLEGVGGGLLPLSIASSLCWVKTKAPAFDYKAGALFLALT